MKATVGRNLLGTQARQSPSEPPLMQRPISEVAFVGSIVFLPFQQAFSINVGFPLKISEMLIVIGLAALLFDRRPTVVRPSALLPIVGLAFVLLLSTVAALVRVDRVPASAIMYPQGITLDTVIYAGYGFLALAFAVVISMRLGPTKIAAAYSLALRLAGVYAVLQLLAWFAGIDLLHTVNGATQIGSLYSIPLPRNGPFLEGNYFGFFAAGGIFLSAYRKDTLGVLIAIALTLYSQSSGATIGVLVALLAVSAFRVRVKTIGFLLGLGFLASAATLLIPAVGLYVQRQLIKIGLVQNTLDSALGYSLRARTANAETGFSMAIENPLLGVGPGRYGYNYFAYLDTTGLPDNFGARAIRPIANNAYAQIGSEMGVFALIIFVLILLICAVRARKRSGAVLALLVFISIAVVATPAWTGLPVWTLLGFAIAATGVPVGTAVLGPPTPNKTGERALRRGVRPAVGTARRL